ncbi:MAG: AN1-type zinc finger domain-containing protein [Verrucomicrobia bacterium]|nr:AN1-type zinc finger domain-containing protein [Verrucomicrobiota bacterium]
MAKPVGTTSSPSTLVPLVPGLPKSDKPLVNAFDMIRQSAPLKKTALCQMQACDQKAYLVLGKTTCEKCQKVFCRTHYPEDKHECSGLN